MWKELCDIFTVNWTFNVWQAVSFHASFSSPPLSSQINRFPLRIRVWNCLQSICDECCLWKCRSSFAIAVRFHWISPSVHYRFRLIVMAHADRPMPQHRHTLPIANTCSVKIASRNAKLCAWYATSRALRWQSIRDYRHSFDTVSSQSASRLNSSSDRLKSSKEKCTLRVRFRKSKIELDDTNWCKSKATMNKY